MLSNRYFLFALSALFAIFVGFFSGIGYGTLSLIVCAYIVPLALLWPRAEALTLYWLGFSPIAAYLLRYPAEKSVLTFDRVIVGVLVCAVVVRLLREPRRLLPFGWFELFWLLFATYALADCLLRGDFSLASLKIAVDAFILPLLLFIVARYGLKITHMQRGIFIILLVLSYCLLPIGVYELLTGADLLRYPGAELYRDGLVRPNGPFLADNSYALISLLIGLALWYWPVVAEIPMTVRLRLFWRLGILCALSAALVPQFRAIALAIIGCLGLGLLLHRGWRTIVKPALAFALLLLACLPIWSVVRATDFYQRRLADPTNAYSRLATYRVALKVAREQWLFGVGLGHYQDYFARHYAPAEMPLKPKQFANLPQSTPHNNLLSVLAELGVVGFLPYLLAQLFLLREGWSLLRQSGRRRAAGSAILTLIAAYGGVGLTLTSGYYSDLNLIFFFLLGILLNCGWEGEIRDEVYR
ncbi:MAG: O-antigen ligase family protein [Acidobacteriota bacterium]